MSKNAPRIVSWQNPLICDKDLSFIFSLHTSYMVFYPIARGKFFLRVIKKAPPAEAEGVLDNMKHGGI